ncbi:hypothetical protein CHCC14821_4208 [Bacillus paralicheniformis]|nr:hypothetical protein CHCC14821_4208 [Bacillus paralicheniformis]
MACEGLQSFTTFVRLKKDGMVDAVFFYALPRLASRRSK